jgi:hypothetical protein
MLPQTATTRKHGTHFRVLGDMPPALKSTYRGSRRPSSTRTLNPGRSATAKIACAIRRRLTHPTAGRWIMLGRQCPRPECDASVRTRLLRVPKTRTGCPRHTQARRLRHTRPYGRDTHGRDARAACGRAREGDGEDRGRSILEPVSTGFPICLEAPGPVLKQTAQAR